MLQTGDMQATQTNTIEHFKHKIAEGDYREVYESGDNVFKVLKPSLYTTCDNKLIGFIKHVGFYFRMLVWDVNQYEYNNFNKFIEKIPYTCRKNFSAIIAIKKIEGKYVSISHMIRNADGEKSIPLKDFGLVDDTKFWQRLERVEKAMVNQKMYLLGITESNIVVQHMADGTLNPVFIDYKRAAGHTYPMQIWLMSNANCIKKMQRQLHRLKEKYNPNFKAN